LKNLFSCFEKNMNAYGTGGTAGRVAALMVVAETESERQL
jgi:hypothetical protein